MLFNFAGGFGVKGSCDHWEITGGEKDCDAAAGEVNVQAVYDSIPPLICPSVLLDADWQLTTENKKEKKFATLLRRSTG